MKKEEYNHEIIEIIKNILENEDLQSQGDFGESFPEAIKKIDARLLRDLPNWSGAPVPVCMGGDYRGLTWCCKPGYSLTFGYKCQRDRRLKEIGMDHELFILIKETFSRMNRWDSSYPCFGSLSYCCMRQSGCFRRDPALKERYPNMSWDEIYAEYVRLKRILANIILIFAENKERIISLVDPAFKKYLN
ncbi:MAG: hypothetical protein ACTSU2_13265 [Promethearchaeota archaeon]